MQRHVRLSLLLLTVALAASAASAQQVYRQVDRNGKVIFSDQPPPASAQPAAPRGSVSAVEGGAIGGLPYELQQVAHRYPVTIYTRDDCAPCDSGRALLNTRGVPFNERLVKTPADVEAFQRLSGETSMPLLAIGGQQLKGFSDTAWSQYLDAAGYPKSVRLPTGYRNPPAQPMVAQQAAPVAAPAPTVASPALPPVPPAAPPSPSNPAGIKF